MKGFLLSTLTWVLEFICVTFGCADYLEAVILIPFLCGGGIVAAMAIVAAKREFYELVMQFKAVRRFDYMANLMLSRWHAAALRVIRKKMEVWYEKLEYRIIQKERWLLIEQQRTVRRLNNLSRRKK